MVGRIVVERGLVTADELDEALDLAAKRRQMDPSLSVAEVLVKEDMITRRQLDRVRGEYETDKNSQQIPGYTILRKLGSGAMATVFLARQLSLDRLVAIKVLPKRFSANDSFIERFYREVLKLAAASVTRERSRSRDGPPREGQVRFVPRGLEVQTPGDAETAYTFMKILDTSGKIF